MKPLSGLKPLVGAVLIACVAGLSALAAGTVNATKTKRTGDGEHVLRLGPPALPTGNTSSLGQPSNPAGMKPQVTATALAANAQIDAKLLVLSADGNEVDLPAITQALDYQGTPYTVWVATQHPGQLTPDVLASGSHAFYQGVILTTNSLGYFSGSQWTVALTAAEWTNLWNFEVTFGVRQVSFYTYPSSDLGYGAPSEQDTTSSPLSGTLTPEGASVFSYLNAATPVKFTFAYCYKAPITSPADTTALLVDASNNALAAVHRYADGRENLAITCDSAPYLIHSVTLSYGVINWVTRGTFLGYRRVYAGAQVDDYFIDDDIYTGGVYRMNGTDVTRLVTWQNNFRLTPQAADFRLEMAFNGEGTEPDYVNRDTLVAATKANQGQFKWMSHTYTHANLDAISYANAYAELSQNITVANNLGLTLFSRDSLICPDVSGLYNPDAMRAIKDIGIRYVVSDASKPPEANPAPNLGIVNALQPLVFEIPRRPTNLFYNVSTPSQWVAEYNYLYRSYWGRDLTYAEILDKESDVLLMYLIKGEMDPWMFHQPNLRAYDGVHSLLGDLLDKTMGKYKALYNLPWVSPTMSGLGKEMAQRTQYAKAGVTATLGAGVITLTATQDAVVPVTGLNGPNASLYGGQYTTFVTVPAGQTVTVPLQ